MPLLFIVAFPVTLLPFTELNARARKQAIVAEYTEIEKVIYTTRAPLSAVCEIKVRNQGMQIRIFREGVERNGEEEIAAIYAPNRTTVRRILPVHKEWTVQAGGITPTGSLRVSRQKIL